MKRNSDRDIIVFNSTIEVSEKPDQNGEVKKYISCAKGPVCDYWAKLGIDDPLVQVGSQFCLNCPYCYGAKMRTWPVQDTGSYSWNGYVKCSINHQTPLTAIKCFWWRITGRKATHKHFDKND